MIAEVRAQIDVDDATALAWLLDRARVLNAEAAWLLSEMPFIGVTGQLEYPLPADCVKTEALVVDGAPYQRATITQMDSLRACGSSARAYSDAAETGDHVFAVNPPLAAGANGTLRFLSDVAAPAANTETPPFPTDITPILADGAIAQGLARMDERFDSAGYFEARFTDGIARLRRRRHGRVGRGAVTIRVLG